jgi:transposase
MEGSTSSALAGWSLGPMAKRSKVELFEEIRKARGELESPSIRDLSRRFGVHRRMVRQALDSSLPPARKVTARPAPSLGPWKATIDAWLAADELVPKKHRHTARRIFERLADEHDAQVSESSVRRYVGLAKKQRSMTLADVCVPQDHPLAEEAEVDFGQISFVFCGVLTEAWMFVMRLSASGKAFHRIYFNQAQEAFFDGHVQAFAHFDGVPVRVRYDNLKPAVVRVLKGRDRVESERFIAMRSHYGFDSFFCRPGVVGAHEKGGVEGEVGRFRRRHLVPMPEVDSLVALNELVATGDERDDRRHVAGRHLNIAAHFALEAPLLRPLPAEPFDVSLSLNCRVDTKSRICVRQCFYSVPVRFAGRRLDVALGADSVMALDGAVIVARHPRAPGKGAETLDLDHYLEVLVIKPGALAGSSALVRARRAGTFTQIHQRFWDQARKELGDQAGSRALIGVLLLHRTMTNAALDSGMCAALSVGSIDPEVVAVEARRSIGRPAPVVLENESLAVFDRPTPTLSHYDDLLGVG